MNVGSIRFKLEQLNTLFSYICDKSMRTLKVLDLFANHTLRRVEQGLLARAVSWLEDVDFRFTELTAKQVNDLCS